MEISNQKRARFIKRGFNLGAVILLLPPLFFVWKEMDLATLISGAVLVLFVAGFLFAGLNYIHYKSTDESIQIRYYPLISFFGREYSSIDVKRKLLYSATVKKTFLFTDLVVEVKTRKGVAEFPSVSLAALEKKDILAIKVDLAEILQQK